jgi:uncharacterized protein (DUF697 family)
MNKKRLPSAIRRAPDVRQAAAEPAMEGDEAEPARAREATAPQEVFALPQPAYPLVEGPLAVRPAAPLGFNAVRRRSQAYAIVERHATYSAAGGIIPLPIINIASVTAINVRMVRMLSNLYGVPFERDRARAIVVGLAGGATPTGLGAAAASTLYYVVPVSALIGLAVSSVAAVACTRSIGRVFVEHFESGATLYDLSTITG